MDIKNERLPIEGGLASKIYLIAFDESKSGWQISHKIYNHSHHGVMKKIKELSKEEYFLPDFKENKKDLYWISNKEIIIGIIREEILLMGDDRLILKKILSSKPFIYLLYKKLPSDLKDISINSLELILQTLDILFIISEGLKILSSRGKEFDMEMDHHNAILNIRNDKDLMYILKQIFIRLAKSKDIDEKIIFDLPLIFCIPANLKQHYSGFSEFGKRYYEMKYISNEISSLLSPVKTITKYNRKTDSWIQNKDELYNINKKSDIL